MRAPERSLLLTLRLACCGFGLTLSATVAAEPEAPLACGAERPWVELSLAASAPAFAERVLGDLRAGLAASRIDVCVSDGGAQSSEPLARLVIGPSLAHAGRLRLMVHDSVTEKALEREIDLDRVPSDGRAFALAAAAEELLRASWAELSVPSFSGVARQAKAQRDEAHAAAPVAPARERPRRTDAFGLRFAYESYRGGSTQLGADVFWTHAPSARVALGVALGGREALTSSAPDGTIASEALAAELFAQAALFQGPWARLDALLALSGKWLEFSVDPGPERAGHERDRAGRLRAHGARAVARQSGHFVAHSRRRRRAAARLLGVRCRPRGDRSARPRALLVDGSGGGVLMRPHGYGWVLALALTALGCSRVVDVLEPLGAAGGGAPDAGQAAPRVQVDAGRAHGCAVSDGALYCWGANEAGQLGLADTSSRLVATQLGSDRDWAEVVAGDAHSCARRLDGSVWCFGANDRGQLGVSGGGVLAPTHVALPAPATALSSEYEFSCAIASARLYCWGQNDEGQLAQNDSFPGADQFAPLPVGSDADWLAISVGQGHACGIRAPGALYCWGRNTDGELGQGAGAAQQIRAPVRVGNDADFASVVAGQSETCAIHQSGALACWGANLEGSLGTGDTSERDTPTEIGAGGYLRVSLEQFHTCAVDVAGTLSCWGRNIEGQLGLGDTADRATPAVISGGPFQSVAVGRFFTCAVDAADGISCTGANDSGGLGVGDTERRSSFTPIVPPM